jgi:hypothetical protein
LRWEGRQETFNTIARQQSTAEYAFEKSTVRLYALLGLGDFKNENRSASGAAVNHRVFTLHAPLANSTLFVAV